jgi:hypothetical protein
MFTRKLTLLACGTAMAGLVALAGEAASATASKTNHLTFSGAIALPGVTLARGAYTFELIEGHPDIVRVLSRDGSQVYFMGFTRKVTRPSGLPAARTVTFVETPPGAATRVNTWYPLGASSGHQFLYPDLAR